MTEAEALDIFQEYVADTTIVSTTFLKQSLKHINNFFAREGVIDETLSTTADAKVVDISSIDDLKKINSVQIDEEYVQKLEGREDKNRLIDDEIQRWEHKKTEKELHFLIDTDETGDTITLDIDKKFIWPAGTDDFDLDEDLQDLLFLGAQIRYLQAELLKVMVSREDLPDVKPTEIKNALKELRLQYEIRIKEIKKARSK